MINYKKSGDIVILEIQNQSELPKDTDSVDLIISNEYIEGYTLYPTKIFFALDKPNSIEDYLAAIDSTKRNSIKKSISNCVNYKVKLGLTSKVDFDEWLKGYNTFIVGRNYGINYIKENWFAERGNKHLNLLFYNDEKMAGGALFQSLMPKQSKISLSFAWYNDDLRKAGGSTYAMIKFIEYAIQNSINLISFGLDTNLYGGHLSIGLHQYKRSWLAQPNISKSAEMKYIYLNNRSKKPMIFYTVDENELIVNKLNI